MTVTRRGLHRQDHASRVDASVAALQLDRVKGAPVRVVPLSSLVLDGPGNPRGMVTESPYTEEKLAPLIASIQERGVLQPLLVREHPEMPERLQLVAGYRRYHASSFARLLEVPVQVGVFSDEVVGEIALLENTMREDLEVVDETFAVFQQLSLRTGLPETEVAKALKSVLNTGADPHNLVEELARLSPLGLSVWANRRRKVLAMTDAELLHVREGALPLSAAEELVRLGHRAERQEILSEAVVGRLTVEQVRHRVAQVLSAKQAAQSQEWLKVRRVVKDLKPARVRQLPAEHQERVMALVGEIAQLLSE